MNAQRYVNKLPNNVIFWKLRHIISLWRQTATTSTIPRSWYISF